MVATDLYLSQQAKECWRPEDTQPSLFVSKVALLSGRRDSLFPVASPCHVFMTASSWSGKSRLCAGWTQQTFGQARDLLEEVNPEFSSRSTPINHQRTTGMLWHWTSSLQSCIIYELSIFQPLFLKQKTPKFLASSMMIHDRKRKKGANFRMVLR